MKKAMKGLMTALFAAYAGVATANTQDITEPSSAPTGIMELARNMDCPTNDGYGVAVMNMSATNLHNMFNVRFGNADYVEDFGYRTFIDATSLEHASPQLQAFIAAHECAHHTLGHTYEAYDNGFVPQDRHHRYERQADCEAIRRIAIDYGYRGRELVADVFDELEQVNASIISGLRLEREERDAMLGALPRRSAERKADGMRCAFY